MSINSHTLSTNRVRRADRATFDGDCFVGIDAFSIAAGAEHDLVVTTSSTPVVVSSLHTLTNSGDFIIELREDAAFTGGTAFSTFNADRVSQETDPLVVTVINPTVTDQGTQVFSGEYGGSNSASSIHDVVFDEPIILRANTTYIFRWSHIDSGTRDFTVSSAHYKDIR